MSISSSLFILRADALEKWLNKAKLSVTGPDALIPGLSGGLEIQGYLYNEATFIS